MAITKYTPRKPPPANLQVFLDGELRSVALSLDSLILLLAVLNVPIEIGAPDSGGVGYRALIIPN